MSRNVIERTATGTYHGCEYVLKLRTAEDVLTLTVEDQITKSKWNNDFTATILEAIAYQAGGFRKFDTIVKMLISAIDKEPGLFLDIADYTDLQAVKSRKTNEERQITPKAQRKINNKRYVILTYVKDAEKISYPLPLKFEAPENASFVAKLIKSVQEKPKEIKKKEKSFKRRDDRMHSSVTAQSHIHVEPEDATNTMNFKAENQILKDKCRKLEEVLAMLTTKNKTVGPLEFDLLLKSKQELQSEFDSTKREHYAEVKKLRDKIEKLYTELGECKMELNKLKMQNVRTKENIASTTKNQSTIQAVEDQIALSMSKPIISHHMKQIEELTQELSNLKSRDTKQRNKIKQQEHELELTLKKLTKLQSVFYSKKIPYDGEEQKNQQTPATQELLNHKKRNTATRFLTVRDNTPKNTTLNSPRTENIKEKRVRPVIKIISDPIKSADKKIMGENRPVSTRKTYSIPSWMLHLESDHMKLAERWLKTNFSDHTRRSIGLIQKNSNKEAETDRMESEILQTSRSQKQVTINSTDFYGIRPQNNSLKTEFHEKSSNLLKRRDSQKDSENNSENSIDLRDINERIGKFS